MSTKKHELYKEIPLGHYCVQENSILELHETGRKFVANSAENGLLKGNFYPLTERPKTNFSQQNEKPNNTENMLANMQLHF